MKDEQSFLKKVALYLYYEIALAKDLNLLTCIENMSYPICSQKLDVDPLKKHTEKNYLKEAVGLPILVEFLKANDEIEHQLYEIKRKRELEVLHVKINYLKKS